MELERLSEATVDPDPFVQFASWFEVGLSQDVVDPNAMSLATATSDGRPSARMVLLKGFDERGFVFFTNYDSRKGKELEENPRAALVLYWAGLRRQIRIEGLVERLPERESDEYFATRPHGSQIAARASRQSSIIATRAELEASVEEQTEAFAEHEVPRPSYWGGYLVRPSSFEFWQGQRDRLHDRIRYRPGAAGAWIIERLSP